LWEPPTFPSYPADRLMKAMLGVATLSPFFLLALQLFYGPSSDSCRIGYLIQVPSVPLVFLPSGPGSVHGTSPGQRQRYQTPKFVAVSPSVCVRSLASITADFGQVPKPTHFFDSSTFEQGALLAGERRAALPLALVFTSFPFFPFLGIRIPFFKAELAACHAPPCVTTCPTPFRQFLRFFPAPALGRR